MHPVPGGGTGPGPAGPALQPAAASGSSASTSGTARPAREAFQRDFHISYPSLNDPGDEIALDFRGTVPPAGIPTTLVIGRDGRITARVIGEVSYPGLRGLISQAAGAAVMTGRSACHGDLPPPRGAGR